MTGLVPGVMGDNRLPGPERNLTNNYDRAWYRHCLRGRLGKGPQSHDVTEGPRMQCDLLPFTAAIRGSAANGIHHGCALCLKVWLQNSLTSVKLSG